MVQPLVSVIIPAFNSQDWIRDTLQSALLQTYRSIEILVVDDASTDKTWDLLKSFTDPVRIFRNETNRGISATRNRGIEQSHGEFIALLDHDDLWAPEKLTRQMHLFEKNPDLGLVFSDCLCVTSQGQRWRYFQENPPSREHVLERLLQENFIACPTIVARKSIVQQVGPFNEELRYAEEFDLILRIAQVAPLDYVDEVLATYRIHGGNFSRGKLRTNQERIMLLNRYRHCAPGIAGELSVRYLLLTRLLGLEKHWGEALQSLGKGISGILKHPRVTLRAFLDMNQRRRQRGFINQKHVVN